MNARVTILGVEFDVEFDFQPEEKEILYHADGTGSPGRSACIEIVTEISFDGHDWYDVFANSLDIVKEAIWLSLEDN
jgi:hypothetical protein